VPAAQYGAVGYGVPARRTNTLAIVSLILSCASIIFGITCIGGIITGHIALSQIKRTGEGGRGMALAGVIVGYSLFGIGIIIGVLYVLFIIFFLGIASNAGNFNPSDFG
jgi:hypothetical protein